MDTDRTQLLDSPTMSESTELEEHVMTSRKRSESKENGHNTDNLETAAVNNGIDSGLPDATPPPIDMTSGGPLQIPKCCRSRPSIHTCIVTAFWQFLMGVERSLVLPTLMLYLTKYWGEESAESFYGIILSAFGMSILVAIPFFGYAASRGIRVKVLLLGSNLLEITGNLIYSLAATPGIVFLGRFIAGLGGGCESPLYADIARSTEEKKRTPYIIAIAVGKELGLFVGPVLTLIFANLKFEKGNTENHLFNVYTAPGYVMAALWTIHTFLLIWYPVMDKDGHLVDMNAYREQNKSVFRQIFLEESLSERSTEMQTLGFFRRSFKGLGLYCHYPILVIIFTIFAGSFNSMCFEAFLPLVSIQNYKWTEVEVSYTYLGVFVVLLPATGCFFWMSKCMQDRVTLSVSYGIMTVSYVILLISMCMLQQTETVSKLAVIVLSLVATGIHAWSMPGVITLPDAIFSKFIPLHEMDRAQTIARLVSNGSFTIGMYAGGALGFAPVAVSIIMLVLAFLPLLLLLLRFSAFNVTSYTGSGGNIVAVENSSDDLVESAHTTLPPPSLHDKQADISGKTK